ncbi:MAG: hypothetical protein J5509_02105 [Lachnospiraceae bacterium]|nr:hypothetical protein [Lachnospiraceae bacterium]
MSKEKKAENIILIAFAVLICALSLIWFPLQNVLDNENYENRDLAVRPELTLDNYGTFSGDYDKFFNDHIPFRNYLMTLNNGLDFYVFRRSNSPNVIIGKSGWLFYDTTDADKAGGLGDPIANYKGTNLYTDEELRHMAANLEDLARFMNDQGKEFILFIAPDKERIYSEYMPDVYGKPAEMYRTLQVVEYLRANTGIRVVYPYEDMMEAREHLDMDIYHYTDTHWNLIGGYVGARALLRELGIAIPAPWEEGMTIERIGDHQGDLADMLHLSVFLKSGDPEYEVKGYDEHNINNYSDDFYGEIDFTAENADPRSIYIYRDSFTTNMAPYIGANFSKTVCRHRFSYVYGSLEYEDPDIFVYETVERYLDDARTFSVFDN